MLKFKDFKTIDLLLCPKWKVSVWQCSQLEQRLLLPYNQNNKTRLAIGIDRTLNHGLLFQTSRLQLQ